MWADRELLGEGLDLGGVLPELLLRLQLTLPHHTHARSALQVYLGRNSLPPAEKGVQIPRHVGRGGYGGRQAPARTRGTAGTSFSAEKPFMEVSRMECVDFFRFHLASTSNTRDWQKMTALLSKHQVLALKFESII